MALNTHLQDHLDKRSGGLTYVASGAVAIITSDTTMQRIAELERIADVTGHELSIAGGLLQVVPKGEGQVGVVTITNASPGVVSKATAHGLVAGNAVKFTTSGGLPTGLVAGVTYWVIAAGLTTTAFEVALTPGGAAINTPSAGSGVHVAWKA